MLKRLKYHINMKIKNLLDEMILGTVLLALVSVLLGTLYVLTLNVIWFGILWLVGLIYAVVYFSDAIKYGNIVRKLDQDSLNPSIWISKAYFSL